MLFKRSMKKTVERIGNYGALMVTTMDARKMHIKELQRCLTYAVIHGNNRAIKALNRALEEQVASLKLEDAALQEYNRTLRALIEYGQLSGV